MTFHARLTELLEKAKTSRLSFNDLQDLLTDHAEAIRDLVAAAENLTKDFNQFSHGRSKEEDEMIKALAKLEEA